jgi:hypothetical protein
MAPSRAAAAMLAMLAVLCRLGAADPRTPQLAPSRSDREDEHRLDVQRHELDHGGVLPVAVATPSPQEPANRQRVVGLALLAVGAGSLVVSGVAYGASEPDGSTTAAKAFFGLAVVTGVLGFSLVLSSRKAPPITVAPAAGSGTIGFVLSGSL